MRVYRIVVDESAAGWTWIIKESVGMRSSRTVQASMEGKLRYCVFPTAREAFENALDVLCALKAQPRHDGESEYRPVNKQVIQPAGDAGAVHDAYWEAQTPWNANKQ
jgi:hypothetical protein